MLGKMHHQKRQKFIGCFKHTQIIIIKTGDAFCEKRILGYIKVVK